jgi:GAF domain-containing protein
MELALAQRLRSSLAESERKALAELRAGAPLQDVLDELLRAVEAECRDDTMASILLLDGEILRHGAAPSLPAAYSAAIDGVQIGQGVGSCGTAAYLGHPVYVTDIPTDPLWKDFKDLAAQHGLRACWSTPIEADGKVIATFAIYHTTPRSPTPDELDAIRLVSDCVATAIQQARR